MMKLALTRFAVALLAIPVVAAAGSHFSHSNDLDLNDRAEARWEKS